jgi:hypothetical protein
MTREPYSRDGLCPECERRPKHFPQAYCLDCSRAYQRERYRLKKHGAGTPKQGSWPARGRSA